MDDDSEIVPFEINPVIANAKAVEGFSGAFQMAEMMEVALEHFLREATKFTEDVKLQFAGHSGQFRGAGWIENDLELHGQSLIPCNLGGNR